LSNALRPYLVGSLPPKQRRILVYGREAIPRNCFPAITKALRFWAQRYPKCREWGVVSAGHYHRPVMLGDGRAMKSLGKLPLEAYGELLQTSAVGLSLMASPHPSYPPLEMAHFGLKTVSNNYANKNLALSHENFIAAPDISPETLADALAEACRVFEQDPLGGWRAKTRRPSFLESGSYKFIEELVLELKANIWNAKDPG
jgi:O-antigen biosynthesis protein